MESVPFSFVFIYSTLNSAEWFNMFNKQLLNKTEHTAFLLLAKTFFKFGRILWAQILYRPSYTYNVAAAKLRQIKINIL